MTARIGEHVGGIACVCEICIHTGHYNQMFREEEQEIASLCREDNIAMIPYSAPTNGKLTNDFLW